MKTIIRSEEILMFLFGLYLFSLEDFSWWLFPLLLFLPDISMLGYLVNNKIGAISYNLFHHKGVAILVYLTGIYLDIPFLILGGVILFAHSSMDRIFGYGLKYFSNFHATHLGTIGKEKLENDNLERL